MSCRERHPPILRGIQAIPSFLMTRGPWSVPRYLWAYLKEYFLIDRSVFPCIVQVLYKPSPSLPSFNVNYKTHDILNTMDAKHNDEKMEIGPAPSRTDSPEPYKGEGEQEVFQITEDGVDFRTVTWPRAAIVFLKILFATGVLSIPPAMVSCTRIACLNCELQPCYPAHSRFLT